MGTTVYDTTLGLLFDALVITSVLFGVGCLQVWLYFRKYGSKDSWIIKTAVILVLIFDTCQQCLNAATVYFYSISNHDDATIMLTLNPPLIIQAIFGGLVALFVQMFFIYRIWRLAHGAWYGLPITGIVAACSVTTFGILMSYCGNAVHFKSVTQLPAIDPLTLAANLGAAITDVAITCAIISLLNHSRTGFSKTDGMINRLVTFSLNTGLLTSVNALFAVITLKAWPDTYLYMFFYLMLGRLYTNSLLATLNCRDYIRNTRSNPNSSVSAPQSVPLQAVARQFNPQQSTFNASPSHEGEHIAIRIDTIAQTDGQSDKDYYGSGKGA